VTAQTIITESYPVAKRGMAQAIYGMGVIVGLTLGPPLEVILSIIFLGRIFLYQHPNWDYCHITNTFFCKSPKYGDKLKASRRLVGYLLLTAFIGSLQYILEHGQDDWFNNLTIIILSVITVLV
jgi:DHA2 family multidrug resistance protein